MQFFSSYKKISDPASEHGYEVVEKLPLIPLVVEELKQNELTVLLRRVPNKSSLIASVQTPIKPAEDISHVPCDIVLVIDVSGSMAAAASMPISSTDEPEITGLNVLDLTKHAARTIIQTLNSKDRLGLVTFSMDAKIIFDRTYMTDEAKISAWSKIEALQTESATNLWHGLKTGIELFRKDDDASENIQALYVLTDGMPNFMCPSRGYVSKLHEVLEDHQKRTRKVPSIHTFGFGYNIRSGLLQSIAEVGAGTYSFIPDAGMIGTVFVHAVANLYTTFATQVTLTFRTKGSVVLLQDEGGKTGQELHDTPSSSNELSVKLGNLQYGQSRDILLHFDGGMDMSEKSSLGNTIQTKLTYNFPGSTKCTLSNDWVISDMTSLPVEFSDYHCSRTRICGFLRTLFPLNDDKSYNKLPEKELGEARAKLEDLILSLALLGHTDEGNNSLLQDLAGEEPQGQVRIALSTNAHFTRWGCHYLLSLLNAHAYQMCNSFKDPGPLQYGKNSPLFVSCRAELDNSFDHLPLPKPAVVKLTHSGQTHAQATMRSWNRSSNPCFSGDCQVRLSKGSGSIAIRNLRAGMSVWTSRGPRSVAAVVATPVRNIAICKIGSLSITPWHPIQDSGNWIFPSEVCNETISFSGNIYSVLLAPSSDSNAHTIMVGGRVCVSLGHGIRAGNDARAHKFFGSYRQVVRSLNLLPRGANGVLRCGGMRRDPKSGLACGFIGQERIGRAAGGKGRLVKRIKSKTGRAIRT